MRPLTFNKLIFSGEEHELQRLKPYFKTTKRLESNKEILTFTFNEPNIIFLNCDEEEKCCVNIIKEIRKRDRKSIVVIGGKEKNLETFIELLPLHLSGYLQKPFKKSDIEKLLINIIEDFAPLHSDEKIYLKEGYSFNIEQLTLFDDKYKLIKLTKYEKRLMQILSNKRNSYVSSENIEYTIWEEDSLNKDCNKRLKHLVYCLRKKLPNASIINSYNLGYKLVIL